MECPLGMRVCMCVVGGEGMTMRGDDTAILTSKQPKDTILTCIDEFYLRTYVQNN